MSTVALVGFKLLFSVLFLAAIINSEVFPIFLICEDTTLFEFTAGKRADKGYQSSQSLGVEL